MRLYLVQHGEAKREEEDPERGLTEKGFKDSEKVAKYISNLNIKIKRIFHSGKTRARQTAEIYARYLKPEELLESDGLSPLDEIKIWKDRIKNMDENIMLVGHLPHLSKLASALITEDESKELIKFKMAGTVCLERDEQGKWRILWSVIPEIVSG
ncbi:MAG: phosphohistidine phosphatase SixA [Candidatus Hydrothermarchaeota archaeon]